MPHPAVIMRGATRRLCSVLAVALAPVALRASQPQRFNLSEEKPAARFKVADIDWPAQVGEASICLWHDDRLAALSITIDDNCAPDVPWWREMADAHGFRATWFVITGRVPNGGAAWGTWETFQQLLDEGHAVESHTVEHLHTEKKQPDGAPWGIEWEYTGSLAQLRENLKGRPASALAYPGGGNKAFNDRALATKLYRSARGGIGASNPANQIDYLSVNGMTGFNIGNEKQAWADLNNIVDPAAYNGRAYRGWAVLVSHKVTDKFRSSMREVFAFIDARREQLWLGLFPDVAKYGQERDTARLEVSEKTASRIQFSVTDGMDDAYFDHPLSVKLRVPDAWASVAATQAGKPVPVRRVVRDGATYAIVQAVPDRGPVACTP